MTDHTWLVALLAHVLTLVERDQMTPSDPMVEAMEDLKAELQKLTELDVAKMRSMGFDKILSLAFEKLDENYICPDCGVTAIPERSFKMLDSMW
jgi:hypothetical protein